MGLFVRKGDEQTPHPATLVKVDQEPCEKCDDCFGTVECGNLGNTTTTQLMKYPTLASTS